MDATAAANVVIVVKVVKVCMNGIERFMKPLSLHAQKGILQCRLSRTQ
jgi:hypothetical protein